MLARRYHPERPADDPQLKPEKMEESFWVKTSRPDAVWQAVKDMPGVWVAMPVF